jgi:hypothetical protein
MHGATAAIECGSHLDHGIERTSDSGKRCGLSDVAHVARRVRLQRFDAALMRSDGPIIQPTRQPVMA